jgi:hypothetical protein
MMGLSFAKKTVKHFVKLDLIHFECSAATGDNIDEVFTSLTKHIINKIENGIIEPSSVMSSYASTVKPINISDKQKEKERERDKQQLCERLKC